MLSEDTSAEVLHAHYVDTFGQIRNALGQRDHLFAYIVATVAVLLLQVVAPEDTDAVIGKLISEKLTLTGTLSLSLLTTVVWFALLGLVIRYFQTVIYIERQYEYIHSVEELLAVNYGGKAFTREGKSYMSEYPLFSNWAGALYTKVFPMFLVVVLIVKLVTEFGHAATLGWLLVFDTVTLGTIAVSVVLYIISLHGKR